MERVLNKQTSVCFSETLHDGGKGCVLVRHFVHVEAAVDGADAAR